MIRYLIGLKNLSSKDLVEDGLIFNELGILNYLTVWDCKYHIVWVPKKRRKIVYGKLREETGTILRRLSEYKGVDMIEGKACIDHIHVCLSIPPKFSVSTVVGYLKGKSGAPRGASVAGSESLPKENSASSVS
ncbi:MAG: putative transposase [Candidatus Scalindua rubra]|uniref:Putative transposase n=1 Tax=Candidatus Scalindua rubra TaxID=1872076 RepID=A0A1E3X4X8_9BACT|nr:MAG: putative transposase [Candidatus Scalindua rubra]